MKQDKQEEQDESHSIDYDKLNMIITEILSILGMPIIIYSNSIINKHNAFLKNQQDAINKAREERNGAV